MERRVKRIDMIDAISKWLLNNAPETYVNQDDLLRHDDAKNLLDLIEKLGMLPPTVPTLTIGELVVKSENCWEKDLESEIKDDILK